MTTETCRFCHWPAINDRSGLRTARQRAAGIRLVLATQRLDRAVVTGPIKSNLPLKVCLKVANSVNARIVLDEPGAESQFGKGDLLCDFGRGLLRADGLFIPQPEFLAALAPRR